MDYNIPKIKKYNTMSYFKLNKYEDWFLNYCNILIFPPENKIANSYLNNVFTEEKKSDKMIINYDYIDDLLTWYTRFLQDRHYEDWRLYMYSSHLKTLDEFTELIDAIFNRIRWLWNWLIHETFLTIWFQLNDSSTVMSCFEDLFLLDEDSYSSIQLSIAHNQFLQKSHINLISSDNLEKSSIKIIPYKYNKIKKFKTIYYSVEADIEAWIYKSLNMEIFPPENKIHKGFW